MNADLGNSLADFLLAFISVYQRFHFYAVGNTSPRVAIGLQGLQRCSGLLNRRARGSTVATHHFANVAQQRQQQFRKLPGALPHESANLSIGSISASVVKLLSSSASNGEFAGGSPAGCTNFKRESLLRHHEHSVSVGADNPSY